MSKCIHMNEAMLCYQCKYVELVKENEDLKLQLLDRTEKYRIAMDKGVWELWNKVNKLTKALEVAESALNKYKDTSVRGWSMEDKRKDIFVAEYALEQINRIKNDKK